jgi:hypothetical protein
MKIYTNKLQYLCYLVRGTVLLPIPLVVNLLIIEGPSLLGCDSIVFGE